MSLSFTRSVIEEFRAHGGRVGGPFEGADLLLLTTTGARSGLPRTTPLGYVRHGGALLVVGSNLGAPRHPAWYHNLLAHPVVRVEVGTRAFEALAVPTEGARRAELFREAVRVAPGYGDYQASTERELPVVELAAAEPEGWAGPPEVRTLADKILEVHAWLRGQLRQVAAETEAHFAARDAHRGEGAPPVPGLGLQIRQRCLAFCQTLRFHHDGEDGHVFPVMAGHHPELAEVFARLGEEHRVIAGVQERLAALLAGVGVAEPERFRTELRRMSAELLAHLAYEEETVVPLLMEIPWPPVAGGQG
ncbi:nitroreductase/quinone reductase family protein [Streptomyces benahoarensis]|uniref:Nitroreductase family deazaflavin-dependent oxidoreductase n=1 Tax=Streptomyces benahoarensis TaxID=2595054 RepID=A0A553ZLJ5_9ACTN|nr:nitroreductase/quinone reductase family protein [Streptomyces benahoarensis]TSB23352.1 nitroreductase family deazaflavin-dependent oxidoreductase [Streptomyces benahoarensis]TSB42361.1 nitroreductase family deazaflavin-dependent oxidoreductase [Streptomyces benahoarensis]